MENFLAVMDWALKQRAGSPHARFSIFRIRFEDPQLLGSTYGAAGASRRLTEFGNSLAATVRKGDIVTREIASFWVFTPECDNDVLGCRLCDIVSKARRYDLDISQCSVGAWIFPLGEQQEIDARDMLSRLDTLASAFAFDPNQDCPVAWAARTGKPAAEFQGTARRNCHRATTTPSS
jgi:hypothetical protein